MKKRLLGLLLGVMLISVCVGCGAENTSIEPTETVETTATTQESTTEQTIEATATSEETVEPTPKANIEAVEEATIEPETTEPTETVEPEQTEASTPEPVPQYTYTDMSATMYAQQTVNVRDLPDTSGNKLGSLSTNDEITISGQCNETSWYRFEYNGSVAFVSNKYVSENKVEIQQTTADNSSGQASSGVKNWQDYYQDHVWYDEGEFMFIIVDSRDEGCSSVDYSSAEATLQERFPDEKVFLRYGSELRDGHWMYFAYVRPETNGVSAFNKPFK